MSTSSDKMRTGHVAMLDALGWKGIWKRHAPEHVLAAAEDIRRFITENMQLSAATFDKPSAETIAMLRNKYTLPDAPAEAQEEIDRTLQEIASTRLMHAEMLFLSDTVVIGMSSRLIRDGKAALPATTWLSHLIARLTRMCATGQVPLAFRGAIAKGQFVTDQNLLLGPAIDSAAEIMNTADASLVWFHPAISDDELAVDFGTVFRYRVPLHGGRTVNAWVVNPFYGTLDAPEADAIHTGILSAFGDETRLEVTIKRQNTEAFLDAAREQWSTVSSTPFWQGIAESRRLALSTAPTDG